MAREGHQPDTTTSSESTDEGGRIRSLDELHDKVDQALAALKDLLPGGPREADRHHDASPQPAPAPQQQQQTAAASAEDRRREMREAFADLRAQERTDEEHASILTRLTGVEERTAEKPPRELRRIEQFFKWGDS
jgi:hypothetical protein